MLCLPLRLKNISKLDYLNFVLTILFMVITLHIHAHAFSDLISLSVLSIERREKVWQIFGGSAGGSLQITSAYTNVYITLGSQGKYCKVLSKVSLYWNIRMLHRGLFIISNFSFRIKNGKDSVKGFWYFDIKLSVVFHNSIIVREQVINSGNKSHLEKKTWLGNRKFGTRSRQKLSTNALRCSSSEN